MQIAVIISGSKTFSMAPQAAVSAIKAEFGIPSESRDVYANTHNRVLVQLPDEEKNPIVRILKLDEGISATRLP